MALLTTISAAGMGITMAASKAKLVEHVLTANVPALARHFWYHTVYHIVRPFLMWKPL